MKFYYFGGNLEHKEFISKLENCHFEGVLFTYNPNQGDFFTLLARSMDLNQKIKYMIAIRPHALSAQYLCMINASIEKIMKDRLQINLIAGHIKEDEKDFGGILGAVTDLSSVPERVNYLIDYIKQLKEMEKNPKVKIPDFYVSCTNSYLYDATAELKYKIILPYRDYKNEFFIIINENDGPHKKGPSIDIKNKKIMLAVNPILRSSQEEIDKEFPEEETRRFDEAVIFDRRRLTTDTEYFTYKDFEYFIKNLELQGINEILMNSPPMDEFDRLTNFVKQYVENN